ncbi:MAG: hypothetical protein ACE3JP_00395 [Ectobacillus sp.]
MVLETGLEAEAIPAQFEEAAEFLQKCRELERNVAPEKERQSLLEERGWFVRCCARFPS